MWLLMLIDRLNMEPRQPSPTSHRLLDCFHPVSESTVLGLLQNIDVRKSAGSDGRLPGCILKKCAKDLAPFPTNLINTSLTSIELSSPLKLATVTPVFKSGDKSLASQYCPISLLPLVSKLLEKVVDLQLWSYLEEFTVIPKEQFAYRPQHSTEDALVYATNNFLLAKDQSLYTGLVFVDMSKAFDRVQHQALINDLSEVGVRGLAFKWFIKYLTDRQQQVRCRTSIIPHGLQSWHSTRKCSQTTLVFTVHQRHPRNPARISQVPTFCWWHSYLLERE